MHTCTSKNVRIVPHVSPTRHISEWPHPIPTIDTLPESENQGKPRKNIKPHLIYAGTSITVGAVPYTVSLTAFDLEI